MKRPGRAPGRQLEYFTPGAVPAAPVSAAGGAGPDAKSLRAWPLRPQDAGAVTSAPCPHGVQALRLSPRAARAESTYTATLAE